MKKKLNLITLFLGIAIGIATGNFLKEEFYDIEVSLMESGNSVRDDHQKKFESCYLTLKPKEFSAMPDSVFNKKSGQWIPARTIETYVRVPLEQGNYLEMLWIFPCVIALLTGFIMIIFNFSKMIYSVKKSVIFDWINVKRLRRIGIGFLLLFTVVSGMKIYYNRMTIDLVEMENYDIVTSSINGTYLLFGMISFLVAEIFAMGLRLKEEQDLTI